MHNDLFDPSVPVPSGFVQLLRAWEVRADASYQNIRPQGYPAQGWLLVRTLRGRGFVELAGARRLDCGPETLLLLDPRRLRAYGCVQPLWTFWWFECGPGSVWPFPADVPMQIPALEAERRQLELCVRRLRQGVATAGMASATLLLLCHQWNASCRAGGPSGEARWTRIQEVMRQMQATAERPMPIPHLARLADLSEGCFRRLFRETAGCAPKAYYENLRLARAVVWLQSGQMKLADIAERLNYSSAFHFSRAFTKRYGRPPSGYRPGISQAKPSTQ